MSYDYDFDRCDYYHKPMDFFDDEFEDEFEDIVTQYTTAAIPVKTTKVIATAATTTAADIELSSSICQRASKRGNIRKHKENEEKMKSRRKKIDKEERAAKRRKWSRVVF